MEPVGSVTVYGDGNSPFYILKQLPHGYFYTKVSQRLYPAFIVKFKNIILLCGLFITFCID